MNKEMISARQVSVLSFFLIRSLFLLFGITSLFVMAKNDILIVIPIGTILGLIPLLLYNYINNKLKGDNIYLKIKKIFNKPLGLIINITIIILLLLLGSYLLLTITSYISYSLVPKISLLAISLAFLLLALNISYKGIETIARTSEILLFIFILLFSISLIGLGGFISLNNIRPLLSTNITSIINASLVYAGLSTAPLFLLSVIPKASIVDTNNYTKRKIITYLITSLIIWIFCFLTLSILGDNLTLSYSYPTTLILKKVRFLKIIERLEGILSIHWLFDLILLMSLLLLNLKEGIKVVFNLNKVKDIKKSLILIGVFLFLGSNYIKHQMSYYIIMLGILGGIIPLIIGIKLRKDKS
ncbi:MAG: GerAB/ArcD/ProY family transporter [Bacilli bacterium]